MDAKSVSLTGKGPASLRGNTDIGKNYMADVRQDSLGDIQITKEEERKRLIPRAGKR